MILHIFALGFVFLLLISILGNGCVIYIFLKVVFLDFILTFQHLSNQIRHFKITNNFFYSQYSVRAFKIFSNIDMFKKSSILLYPTVIYLQRKEMRSTSNMFIVNLAISDLIMMLTHVRKEFLAQIQIYSNQNIIL